MNKPVSPHQESLTPFMRRVLRRMAWRHAVPWLARGLAAGILAAAALLLIAHVVAWEGAAWWALGAGVVLVLGGVAAAWLTRPAPAAALRDADHALGLRDRLTTAWEFGASAAPMLRLQRDDLAAHADRLDLRAGLRLRPPRREAVAPLAGVMLLIAALVLPNPQARVLQAHAATHARIVHAAARVGAAQKTLGTLPRATLAALPKADRLRQLRLARILATLRRALAATHSPAQALKAIARAQTQLNRLSPPHVAAQRAALSALASALARSAATRSLAQALRQGNPAAISKAMHNLAKSLAHMPAAQRANLARAMQQAAHAAAQDPAVSQSLQNAATALAQQDMAAARAALQASGQQAAADAARSAQQAALDQANGMLDNARNDISGLSRGGPSGPSSGRGPGGKGTGAGGKGQGSRGKGQAVGGTGQGGGGKGQGQGNGNGQGQGNGNGQGQGNGNGNGNGAGQGQGNGAGKGQGSGSGSGSGSGGHGQGGGNGGGGASGSNRHGGNNGNAPGSRVYIPASEGSGPSRTSTGTQGAPSRGSLQPWRSVLPAYERGASASLENGALPPDQTGIVKSYFDHLSH